MGCGYRTCCSIAVCAALASASCNLIASFEAGPATDAARRGDATRTDGSTDPPDVSFEAPTVLDGGAPCAYAYRAKITIAAAGLSSACTSDLTNFPLLVMLSSDGLKSASVALGTGHVIIDGGDDIVFTAADGTTVLDHEIERYDANGGRLVAWVSVPLLSRSKDTVIFVQYGNPMASTPPPAKAARVWDAANYRGVWHLSELLGNARDSTSYAAHGTPSALGVTRIAGPIAGAYGFERKLRGTVDMGSPSDRHLDFSSADNFTIELWLSAEDFYYYSPFVVSKRDCGASSCPGYSLLLADDMNAFPAYEVSSDGPTFYMESSMALRLSQWRHVVAVFDRSNGAASTIYVDGQPTSVKAYGQLGSVNTLRTPAHFRLDGPDDLNDNYMFSGGIDEVRVSAVARDRCWIETSFNNQRAGSTLISVGPEQPTAAPCVSK